MKLTPSRSSDLLCRFRAWDWKLNRRFNCVARDTEKQSFPMYRGYFSRILHIVRHICRRYHFRIRSKFTEYPEIIAGHPISCPRDATCVLLRLHLN